MPWKVDPTKHYDDVPVKKIVDALGYVPHFLLDEDERPLQDQVRDRYPYFMASREEPNIEVEDDGAYTYPGDPKSYPLAVFRHETNGEKMYMYEYAIVIFVDKEGKTCHNRLD